MRFSFRSRSLCVFGLADLRTPLPLELLATSPPFIRNSFGPGGEHDDAAHNGAGRVDVSADASGRQHRVAVVIQASGRRPQAEGDGVLRCDFGSASEFPRNVELLGIEREFSCSS